MKREGNRYPLLIYTRMLDRWWPATLFLAVALFVLAWGISDHPAFKNETLGRMALWFAGGLALLVTLILWGLRSAAYVQPRAESVRIATPFLRFDISYKRVRRVISSEMHVIFPLGRLSAWNREILEPLMHKTAIILELNSWPLSPRLLRLFLSPFFFRDQTPHFVLLVENWMRLSTELESFRSLRVSARQ
ncbi:MAG: hypothetical protein J7555_00335 [Chloroflexi bacterium]|nr:hypothetical protein [Chloroflexota bacterium]